MEEHDHQSPTIWTNLFWQLRQKCHCFCDFVAKVDMKGIGPPKKRMYKINEIYQLNDPDFLLTLKPCMCFFSGKKVFNFLRRNLRVFSPKKGLKTRKSDHLHKKLRRTAAQPECQDAIQKTHPNDDQSDISDPRRFDSPSHIHVLWYV